MKILLNFIQSLPALHLKNRRLKQAGLACAVLLLASAIFLFFRAYSESKAIREYVGGPFSSQLLYLQGCASSTADGGVQAVNAATLEEQSDECRRSAGGRPGYYVYDFNIGRSVALSKKDIEAWREYSIFALPDSIDGRVENSQTNTFNRIIPFEEFTGFDYDCALTEDENVVSCEVAAASCVLRGATIRCSVFNPRTESRELHVIEQEGAFDLLLPQGFISGPDLFKLMKPRFFPVLERM